MPQGWERIEIEGVDLALAAPQPSLGFRPNVVLTSVDSDAPIEQASVVALAAAGSQHPGAIVVSCDVWVHSPHPGRTIVFSYSAGDDSEVVVMKWVWATGSRHVHLAASCAIYQYLSLEQSFTAIATAARFEDGA